MSNTNVKTSDLKKFLDQQYGDEWKNFEPETITSEFGNYSALLNDQVEVLRCIETSPELVFDNGLFLLHVVDVLNHNQAEFRSVPWPTSLELAWAITELERIFGDARETLKFSNAIQNIVTYLLKHEGYRSPTKFLAEYCLPEFAAETTPEPEKEKAIELYIKGMDSGSPN